MKVELEPIKKSHTEIDLEIKIQEVRQAPQRNITSRILDMGKKVSGTKDKREEMLNKQQKTPKNQSNKQIEAKSPGNPEYQEKLKSKNNIIREIKKKSQRHGKYFQQNNRTKLT